MNAEFDEKKYKPNTLLDMNITLKKYIFFPAEKIEGFIELVPKTNIQFKKIQKINFKLIQFIKCECIIKDSNGHLHYDSKSSSKEILIKNIDFENSDFSKKIKIEFDLLLPGEEEPYFFPTFEFRKNDISIFIRHLFTIEIPDLEVCNSTGVIICKLPEKKYLEKKDLNKFKDKNIKTLGLINKGKLTYYIKIKKLSYSFDDEIFVKLNIITTELKDLEIDSIEFLLQKKIAIKDMSYGLPRNKKEERIIIDSRIYEGKDVKKNILKFCEKFKFKKFDIPDFTEKDIEKYTIVDKYFIERDDQRMQLSPSIDNDLFLCQYKIKIIIHFNSYFKGDIIEEFILDLFTMKPSFEVSDYLKNFFLINANPEFNSEEFLKENEGIIDDYDNLDFVVFEQKDFHSLINEEDKK